MGYSACFKGLDNFEHDEKYALLSHSIQLGKCTEAIKYNGVLFQNELNIKMLPSESQFNTNKGIAFSEITGNLPLLTYLQV